MREQTDGSTEALAQHLSLLDFARVDLTADDGAEGDLGPELLRDRERERRLACARPASEEERPARELLELDERGDEAAGLDEEAMERRVSLWGARCRRQGSLTSRAWTWPTKPAALGTAEPSSESPSPLLRGTT